MLSTLEMWQQYVVEVDKLIIDVLQLNSVHCVQILFFNELKLLTPNDIYTLV